MMPILALVFSLISFHLHGGVAGLENDSSNRVLELNPSCGMLGLNKTLTIWQIPQGVVKKVLFMAHAANVEPYDFWDPHPNCPLCTGLPENRAIVLDALSRNYAVVAIAAISRTKAWDAWPQDSPDILNVVFILSTWTIDHCLENVPLVGLGASSGGLFLSTLGLRTGLFESVTLMISSGVSEAWDLADSSYPPTLFMHMPKDKETASYVQSLMKLLHRHGVPSEQVMWYQVPVTPDWFAQRIPGLNESTSSAIREALKGAGVLDNRDYLALPNYDWTSLIRQKDLLPEDPLHPGKLRWQDHVQQELKVAEALHVTFSTRDEELFRWLEDGYKKPHKSFSDI